MSNVGLDLIRRSDLYGFYRRLKTLGFTLDSTEFVDYKKSKYTYIKTVWSFSKRRVRLQLIASIHKYRLIIKDGKVSIQRTTRCWSGLEKPFLSFFNERKPLSLRRLVGNKPWPKIKTQNTK